MQSIDELISSVDLFLFPVYLLGILIIAFWIKNRNKDRFYEYKYFVPALLFKIVGTIIFCLVYIYYYEGGDTISYFFGSRALSNLLVQDFNKGYEILFNTDSPLNHINSFNYATGYPPTYMFNGAETFNVCRYSVVFTFIGSRSFLITSILIASFSFVGVWKFYRLLNYLYPDYSKQFAFLILFLPSLAFWGSGIMKDSYVLCSTCWISYNFYMIFIRRKKLFWNIIFFAINLLIILNIKSYVILSLLPGMMLWLNNAYLISFKSFFIKLFVFPIITISIFSSAYFAFNNLSSFMGVYGDVDTAIQQAQIIQTDLLREEQYGANSYNIGEIDGSASNLLNVAPTAIFTALYRPLFWEIGSPTMLFSVIENTILLLFSIYILIITNPIRIIRYFIKDPFLLYCFIFSIFFAFGVGIAGTNFGALVRYKIPLIPFYFPMIFLLYKSRNKNN